MFSQLDIAFALNWSCLQDGPVSIQEKFEYIMYGRLYEIKADGLSHSPPEVYVNVSHVILLYLYTFFNQKYHLGLGVYDVIMFCYYT